MYKKLLATLILLAVVLTAGAPAFAQSSLEELAKQQISQKTGLDPNQLAVLFINGDTGQFILAFALINEKMMQSSLKPELKQAVAAFVGQKALLTLVAPSQVSTFDPFQISFQQNGQKFSITTVTPITNDFAPGPLQPQTVSAGVLSLNASLDIAKNFKIFYGSQSTTFSISGKSDQPSGNGIPNILLFLQIIFFQILLIFLIPFLLGI
ncbi:hypothetical protein HYR54_12090 [Candidatus Acetothermia bacterium]|nr:hypothetical protein [Candidatus Acetothermia bacterium]MBI3460469.1 hypothetical protein [Candidatus Acetothermia bacterium]MBI3660480.1 hypothetical protein [Candidatus Acetothermia bacterium]